MRRPGLASSPVARRRVGLFLIVGAGALVLGSTLNGGVGGVGSDGGRAPDPRIARVVEVVDGDTIRVRFVSGTERTVRYIGIDAPDTRATGEPDACFGPRAARENAALLGGVGARVRLEFDERRSDDAGRLLAYAYRPGDERLLNAALLRGGFATVLTEPPNLRRVDLLLAAGRAAREGGAGLWSACSAQGS